MTTPTIEVIETGETLVLPEGETTLVLADLGINSTDNLRDLLQKLVDGDLANETLLRRLFNALNVAKDGQDRLLVHGNAGGFEIRGIQPWWHGSYQIRYGAGGPNSVDARDALMAQVRGNFHNVRNNRWSVT